MVYNRILATLGSVRQQRPLLISNSGTRTYHLVQSRHCLCHIYPKIKELWQKPTKYTCYVHFHQMSPSAKIVHARTLVYNTETFWHTCVSEWVEISNNTISDRIHPPAYFPFGGNSSVNVKGHTVPIQHTCICSKILIVNTSAIKLLFSVSYLFINLPTFIYTHQINVKPSWITTLPAVVVITLHIHVQYVNIRIFWVETIDTLISPICYETIQIQSTLPKSNSHKSNNRLSRKSIQVLISLFSIVFYPI